MTAAWRSRARGAALAGDQLFVFFGVVLVANAAFCYAYPKVEVLTVAGVFYAFAAFVAVRALITAQTGSSRIRQVALTTLLAALGTVWAFQSLGVHHLLQTQAFEDRLVWARLDPKDTQTLVKMGLHTDARARLLIAKLRQNALELRVPNRYLLPHWADEWWND
jgi:hypothetical protein